MAQTLLHRIMVHQIKNAGQARNQKGWTLPAENGKNNAPLKENGR
jgi:hypothetical protein